MTRRTLRPAFLLAAAAALSASVVVSAPASAKQTATAGGRVLPQVDVAASDQPQLPLAGPGPHRVLFAGSSLFGDVVPVFASGSSRDVVVETGVVAGVADYTDTSLYNWRVAYAELVDSFRPDVVVVHVPMPRSPRCFELIAVSDAEACVELNRAQYLYPVVDAMVAFFASRQLPAVFVGMPAGGVAAGTRREVALHRRANELVAALNTSMRARVEAAGFTFFDPTTVLGDTFESFRRTERGWEQWRVTSDRFHPCPSAVASLVAAFDDVLFGVERTVTVADIDAAWDALDVPEWFCSPVVLDERPPEMPGPLWWA